MMTEHQTGTREEWLATRLGLLERERRLIRAGNEPARTRRGLPWVRLEKEYTFETEAGTRTLSELFAGRSQLLVYHFGFSPAGSDERHGVLSLGRLDDAVAHLGELGVTMVCASRAPLGELIAQRQRMGWSFPWVSTLGSFNLDFGGPGPPNLRPPGADQRGRRQRGRGEEIPRLSSFALSRGVAYHIYSCRAGGIEVDDLAAGATA